MSGSFAISNGPGATIQSLDYWSVSHLIKVTATTTIPAGTLTFGFSANGPALGVLTLETTTGTYQGSVSVAAPPATVLGLELRWRHARQFLGSAHPSWPFGTMPVVS